MLMSEGLRSNLAASDLDCLPMAGTCLAILLIANKSWCFPYSAPGIHLQLDMFSTCCAAHGLDLNVIHFDVLVPSLP